MKRVGSVAVTAATFLLSTPVVAQTRVELAPRVGMYVPVGFLTRPLYPADAPFRQKHQVGTISAGVSAALHWRSFKVSAGADYSPSLVAVIDDNGTRDISSRVILMNIRAGRVFRVDEEWTVDLAAGGGLISRGGEAWKSTGGTLDRAITASVGGSFEIVPGARFRAAADWYLSRLRYTNRDIPAQNTPLRQDLFFTTGIAIPVK